ncbi:SnoaL-like domain, partial [Teratosphaeria destructans]
TSFHPQARQDTPPSIHHHHHHHHHPASSAKTPATMSASTPFDYQAIRNTISLYCLALDTKDFALLPQVFTADVEAIYPIRTATGVDALAGAIEKRLSPVSSHHTLGTQIIEIAPDGRAAKARTYFTGVHFGRGRWEGKAVTAWGTYVDDLVLVDGPAARNVLPGASGQWLIKRRECLWTKRLGEEGVMEGE